MLFVSHFEDRGVRDGRPTSVAMETLGSLTRPLAAPLQARRAGRFADVVGLARGLAGAVNCAGSHHSGTDGPFTMTC